MIGWGAREVAPELTPKWRLLAWRSACAPHGAPQTFRGLSIATPPVPRLNLRRCLTLPAFSSSTTTPWSAKCSATF
jgi:hypothetical protein